MGAGIGALLILAVLIQPFVDSMQQARERGAVRALFADAAIGVVDPEALRVGLVGCRQLPTRPYVDELNQFEVMLRTRDVMEPLRRRQGDFGRPPGDRLQDGVDWLNAYRRLPKNDERWPAQLKAYRQKFDHELKEVLGNAVDTSLKLASEEQHRGDHDRAAEYVLGVLAAVPDDATVSDRGVAAALPEFKKQLDDGLVTIRDRERQSRWKDLLAEIEMHLKADPPGFLQALRKLNTFTVERSSLPPEITADVRKERDQLLDQFWRHTVSRADEAVEKDDFGAVAEALIGFEHVPDLDDERKAKILEYRGDLNPKRLRAKIKLAKATLPKDPERALAVLNEARAYLPGVNSRSPALLRSWYETAIETRRARDEWGEAVQLLRDPDVIAEPWVKGMRTELWEKWAEQLLERVPREELEKAKADISRFLNSGADIPKNLRDKVVALNEGLAPRQMREELKKAEALSKTDPEQALAALLALRADVPTIKETVVLGRWRRAIVDIYMLLGHHPEAVEFVTGLEADVQVGKVLPPAPGMVDEIWAGYAKHHKDNFLARTGDGQREEAWRGLWAGCRETKASDVFLSNLKKFAQDRIRERLGELKERTADSVRDQQFGPALKLVEEARKELGEWTIDPQYDKELRLRGSEVRRAAVASEIASLDTNIVRSTSTEQLMKVDRGISSLLGRQQLDDDDRARLTVLRDGVRGRWEGLSYDDLLRVTGEQRYEAMGPLIATYLDPSIPFAEKRPTDRLRAVQRLKNWLEGFDRPREYVVTKIHVQELPYPSKVSTENEWGGAYDPYVSVTITEPEGPTRITTGADNKGGDFAFIGFSTDTRFTWRKGYQVELGIWDDGVEVKGRCMGRIRGADPYALLRLGLPGTRVDVHTEQYDYKGYPGFDRLRMGLEVSGLEPPPPLPVVDVQLDDSKKGMPLNPTDPKTDVEPER